MKIEICIERREEGDFTSPGNGGSFEDFFRHFHSRFAREHPRVDLSDHDVRETWTRIDCGRPDRKEASKTGVESSRPYVRPVNAMAPAPQHVPNRGLRRAGRRRASDMGDGPDE